MAFNSSILAIGSELLCGQILNRNAQWLSQHLQELGFTVKSHLTVDDEKNEIIAALSHLSKESEYIFVTGGLGPTTDDLTRDAITAWAGKRLIYDPASWAHIEDLFARFQRGTPGSNKQQCYFPEDSELLRNRLGTANGFRLDHNGSKVWVLPGPPREIEGIWDDFIYDSLKAVIPDSEKKITKMWRTVGAGESHLAEILDPIVTGRPVTIAYRAHAPYVEIKISFPAFSQHANQPLLNTVASALTRWLYETDSEDLVSQLGSELNRFSSVDIYDGVTHGQIANFLSPHIISTAKSKKQVSLVTSWEEHDSPRQFIEQCFAISSSSELALAVAGFDAAGNWAFGIRSPDKTEVIERPSVYNGDALRSRNQMAIAAFAIKGWLALIGKSSTH